MRIMSVVGARPEFIQVAPLARVLRDRPVEHVIVHTGQHYDARMSDVFFADLEVPPPDVLLGVGSGTHGRQTGAILACMDEVLEERRPDWVVVFGDTNSTVGGAMSAVKMGIPVAHVEAGLRSFNRRMPEEHNRIVTDHLADVLYAPTEGAVAQLASEGLGSRAVNVGDIKTEITFRMRDAVQDVLPELPDGVSVDEGYYVATIHRAENTDDPERLRAIVEGLAAVDRPLVLLAHPRLVARCAAHGIDLAQGAVRAMDPLPYPQMIDAVVHSQGVVTDSGGLQKEAFLLEVPCVTVRTETEWVETVDLGWNVLAEPGDVAAAVSRPRPAVTDAAPYGRGDTAELIADDLQRRGPRPGR